MADPVVLDVDGREVEVSRPDKVIFDDAAVTKLDLATYYRDVADVMLPHLEGRIVTLQRFPDGVAESGFYQKEVSDHFPAWIERVEVETSDGSQDQVVITSAADLVYLADQGTVTFHRWLSKASDMRRPDLLVFDLDPSGDEPPAARRAAVLTKDLLDELGVPSGVMATGSKGFHVAIPIVPDADFDRAREVARALATRLAEAHPDELTVATRKVKRHGRVFVDYLRMAYAQTAATPYSVRPRPGAPVAHPLDWDELSGWDPAAHTIGSIPRRLAQKPDPWAGLMDDAVALSALT